MLRHLLHRLLVTKIMVLSPFLKALWQPNLVRWKTSMLWPCFTDIHVTSSQIMINVFIFISPVTAKVGKIRMILTTLTVFGHRKINTQRITDSKLFWINDRSSNWLIVISKYNEMKEDSSHSNNNKKINYQVWVVLLILFPKPIIIT